MSVSRKLVRFLPVLASALAVALSGQRSEAAMRRADFPQRQRDIEACQRAGDTLCLLLWSTRGQHHGLRRGRSLRGGHEIAFGHARDLLTRQ